MIETPKELPEGFSPADPKDFGHYPLSFQAAQLLIDLMVGYDAITEIPPTPETPLDAPAHTGAFLRQDGTVVTAGQCATIARSLRSIIQDGVAEAAIVELRAAWNKRADDLKAAAEERGEAPVGFEHFAHSEPQVRGFAVHWGYFNAIAAEHGGYRVT